MSTKRNPSAYRCYEAALPDEHIFTILARDPAGPATLRYWAQARTMHGKAANTDDIDRIEDALRDADLMEEWRKANLDPLGTGVPTWKLPRPGDESGNPISLSDRVEYVPAERDGSEAVRVSIDWLKRITEDLTSGRIDRKQFAELIELACQSPDRRKTESSDDRLIQRLKNTVNSLRDGTVPVPHDLYRAVKNYATEGWTYEAIGIGVADLEAVIMRLRAAERPVAELSIEEIDEFQKRLDEYLNSPPKHPIPVMEPGDKPVIDTEPQDLAHAPEVPPHRFSVLHKGEQYAYARGLEVNPIHLPVALDAMAADGWYLLAIFGQTDSQHVGFIFERKRS